MPNSYRNVSPHVSVSGGVSSRPHVIVLEEATSKSVVVQERDLEVDALDLGLLSGDVEESLRKQNQAEKFATEQNRGPTILTATGYFSYKEDGVTPNWCARMSCWSCGWFEVFPNLATAYANVPEECEDDKPNPECPMFKGKMKLQYDRRNR